RVIDSHIHLWPPSPTHPEYPPWIPPSSNQSSYPRSIDDYTRATNPHGISPVRTAVYVETDRPIGLGADVTALGEWAAGPLAEAQFIREVVETQRESDVPIKGLVLWAPVDRGVESFKAYVELLKGKLGTTFGLVKGWRFLLQGLEMEELKKVVEGEGFEKVLGECRGRWAFDVGVDARGKGVWQLESVVEVVERFNLGHDTGVTFVLNHLCKPDMIQSPTTPKQKSDFERWKTCITRFAKVKAVYMKLSGAFSEMPDQDPARPQCAEDIIYHMRPWLDHVFAAFGPERIMFGSDWPVCNMRGPGADRSWRHWRDVVKQALDVYGLSDKEKDRIWFGTADEAYRL
ncbi:amidohydrolase 2, partial [Trichodelitschia bisporula]